MCFTALSWQMWDIWSLMDICPYVWTYVHIWTYVHMSNHVQYGDVSQNVAAQEEAAMQNNPLALLALLLIEGQILIWYPSK